MEISTWDDESKAYLRWVISMRAGKGKGGGVVGGEGAIAVSEEQECVEDKVGQCNGPLLLPDWLN